jgi:hypothetical protein
MNAERLKAIVESLQAAEAKHAIQPKLTALLGAMANLVGSPADASWLPRLVQEMRQLPGECRRINRGRSLSR